MSRPSARVTETVFLPIEQVNTVVELPTARTVDEIKMWSDEMEASSLYKNPDKRDYFIESCHKLGLNPQMNSTFDWLEADDRESFRS